MITTGRWRDPRVIVLSVCAFLAMGIALVGRAGFADAQAGISGSVFADSDGDGTWDTDEIGQPGVAVWIVGESASTRVVTDQAGAFVADVGQLGGGAFGVLIGDLVGADGAAADPGSAAAVALPVGTSYSPLGASNSGGWIAPLGIGSTVVAGLATCGQCGAVTLGDRVWFDADGDGYQDFNEPPIGGAEVNVLSGGAVIATTSTNADGRFSIGDEGAAGSVGLVVPGLRGLGNVEISVRVTAETAAAFGASGAAGEMELRATTPDVGFDSVDSDGGDTGPFTATALANTNVPNGDIDFGFRLVAAPPAPAVTEPAVTEPPSTVAPEPLPVETVPTVQPVEPPAVTEAPIDRLPVEETPAAPDTVPVGDKATDAPAEEAAPAGAIARTAAVAAVPESDLAATAKKAGASTTAAPSTAAPPVDAATSSAAPAKAPVKATATGKSSTGKSSTSTTRKPDAKPGSDTARVNTAAGATPDSAVPQVLAARASSNEASQVLPGQPAPTIPPGSNDGDDVVVAVGAGKPPVLAELHPTTPVRFGGDVISGGPLPRTGSAISIILSFAVMLVGIGLVLILGAKDSRKARRLAVVA